MLQLISVLGALAILAAYAANQLGWIGPSNLSYLVANFLDLMGTETKHRGELPPAPVRGSDHNNKVLLSELRSNHYPNARLGRAEA